MVYLYNTSDIVFYASNTIRAFNNWNNFVDASIKDSKLVIESGGYASIDLSNLYYNGLKASKYRKLSVSLDADFTDNFKYQDFIEALLVGVYTDGIREYISINIFEPNYSTIISTNNYDFKSLTLLLVNHSDKPITFSSCSLLRSQDINSSQIGEAIGWGVTLNQVIAYQDGCELYYEGAEEPDKLWWMEDAEGVFNGINVNNKRMIKFSRKNEILLD